ncbi:MAG: hypothetical protein Q9227_004992 [Pyrenula ochraceoflavens]
MYSIRSSNQCAELKFSCSTVVSESIGAYPLPQSLANYVVAAAGLSERIASIISCNAEDDVSDFLDEEHANGASESPLDRISNDLDLHTTCLMELLPTLEHTILHFTASQKQKGIEHENSDLQVSEVARRSGFRFLKDFPDADQRLIERLGEANFQSSVRTEQARDNEKRREWFSLDAIREVSRSTFKPASEFEDSGVGDSLSDNFSRSLHAGGLSSQKTREWSSLDVTGEGSRSACKSASITQDSGLGDSLPGSSNSNSCHQAFPYPGSAHLQQDQQDLSIPIPGPSSHRISTVMNTSQNWTFVSPNQEDRSLLIPALHSHQINSITDLRRAERALAFFDTLGAKESLTSAWLYYVNSNNLLNELRGLTGNYPFSSECLDEAKCLVSEDPNSARSWNHCWLVLSKIQRSHLIENHAEQLASKLEMWGNYTPRPQDVRKLQNNLTEEWFRAVRHLLRHWEGAPPTY